MFPISDSVRKTIFYGGIVTLLLGGGLAYLSLQHWDALPNYQRMAVLVPITLSYAMLRVDDFRNWASTPIAERIRAVTALLVPVMLIVACLMWWLAAPGVYG